MLVETAICTWNRSKLLERTLENLVRVHVPAGVEWSILVVNNVCSDDTDQVIARHASQLPIRRLFEPTPGLSHARNCAVEASRGDLLLWIDDDVFVDANWLSKYVQAAREHPAASFFGGPVEPWFEVPPPDWVVKNLSRLNGVYALRDLGERACPFLSHRAEFLPFGANFGVRVSAQKQFAFDPQLGRVQTSMLSCEESALLASMLKAGHTGFWVPDARVRHFIPKERLTQEYLREFFLGLGRTMARMWPHRAPFSGTYLHAMAEFWESAYTLRQRVGPRRHSVRLMIAAHIARGRYEEYRNAKRRAQRNAVRCQPVGSPVERCSQDRLL